MECERVREEFIERLTGTLDADRASAIDQHLAGCPACRAETERLTEMWRELGQLRIPAPTGAGGRIERLIDARAQSGTAAPSRERRALRFTLIGSLAVAASLAIGVLIGQRSATPRPTFATSPSTPTASNASASNASASAPKTRYLLLLHGPAERPPQTAEQSRADSIAGAAIVAEYRAWAMRLRDSGALVTAEKLAANPVTMLSASGATEMPRGTADELGGFFLIQADSAEAYRIARECPHLRHGGTVQVRRIQPT
jgi:hypothetical protein